jgi:hypothetical protein
MDWLLIRESLEKAVFDTVAEVLDLEMDLLFFDTTSTHFVTGRPIPRSPGTSRAPSSRAARKALARAGRRGSGPGQVQGPPRRPAPGLIGMAVTRDEIPPAGVMLA